MACPSVIWIFGECFRENKRVTSGNHDQRYMEYHTPFRRQAIFIGKTTGNVDDRMGDDAGIKASAAIEKNDKQKADHNSPGYLKQRFRKPRPAAVDKVQQVPQAERDTGNDNGLIHVFFCQCLK